MGDIEYIRKGQKIETVNFKKGYIELLSFNGLLVNTIWYDEDGNNTGEYLIPLSGINEFLKAIDGKEHDVVWSEEVKDEYIRQYKAIRRINGES